MPPHPPPSPSPAPELLAPAGNWECARAAVANGADAIYFGMPRFNARLRADNFTAADLPELMAFLHDRGVRGFVAFNTLVFTGELPEAADQLRLLESAGVDAIIVQDIGLARLARQVAPGLELHASTQMTITSPEGLAFAHRHLGLDRAVLARELSLRELARFTQNGAAPPEVPLEVFVHGALCVAYSGQCLTSEALGQRSANRGECAQACRMPYELVVDGETRDLGDRRYLLSPQDLAAADHVGDLFGQGVVSFKIEGRLKSPEYVAAVTRAYRRALDAAKAGKDPRRALAAGDRYAMEMAFSRGQSSGWLEGANHPKLVPARFGKKRGPFVGKVIRAGRDWVELDTVGAALKPGDGIVFDTGGDTNAEQGGRVFEVDGRRLGLPRGKIDPRRVPPGSRVWKTDDPALNRELRATWNRPLDPIRQPLDLRVSGKAGAPLAVSVPGTRIAAQSAIPLQPAQNRPLDESALRAQLGRLGGTRYALGKIDLALEGDVMLPVSELNRLRREIVAALDNAAAAAAAEENPPGAEPEPRDPGAACRAMLAAAQESPGDPPPSEPQLAALCRSEAQLAAALGEGAAAIYCDFEDIRRYAGAAEMARAAGLADRLFLATPRIQKAGEAGFFKTVAGHAQGCGGILVRNLGALEFYRENPVAGALVGDFSLNVANPLTAELFLKAGLRRLTASYDLNIAQLLDLLRGAPAGTLEIVLHQHMPMFHMEHCVFCAFMSDGTDFTNCGRPCEKHDVQLRDRVGMTHTLAADVGCRNTLFRGQAQTAARYYPEIRAAGAAWFRVEFLRESEAAARHLIQTYRALLRGDENGSDLWQRLNADSRLGVVEGTLAV
ncbi:MAG: DUF3656 domain-containing protein [Verrucomicrobiales bacterium]